MFECGAQIEWAGMFGLDKADYHLVVQGNLDPASDSTTKLAISVAEKVAADRLGNE
jgi:hypothetical protein